MNGFKKSLIGLALALSTGAFSAPKKLTYSIDDKPFEGFILPAKKNKAPAILLIHNWMGITSETENQAKRYNALGYTVMAADVYGQGIRPSNPQEAGALAGTYKKDRALFRKHLNVALDTLKSLPGVDPARIAVMGYCFGGTGALELARSGADVRAVISFHGGLDSPQPSDGKNIKAKVLVLHGAEDPFNPKKDVDAFIAEMKNNHVDYTFVAYPNAVHSFTEKSAGNDKSKGAAYNAAADKASFKKASAFLKETLK